MKPKILVYVNNHAAHHLDNDIIKEYLNAELECDDWYGFGDVNVPTMFKDNPDFLTQNFFHGISTQQYTIIEKGGIFVNPFLYGMYSDIELWNNILHTDKDFYQEVMYIDIPFEIFKQAVDGKITQAQYEESSEMVIDVVDKIKENYYLMHRSIH